MDPNEVLRQIEEATTATEVMKLCSDLYIWLKKGGFDPMWLAYPRGTKLYQTTVSNADFNAFATWVKETYEPTDDTPLSENLSPGIDQVPFDGIEAIGAIFAEGEKKYGRDNWKKQPNNKEYNQERTRHAIRHLMLWANGDRSENHLAKVAWFCVTTIWREKQEPIKS